METVGSATLDMDGSDPAESIDDLAAELNGWDAARDAEEDEDARSDDFTQTLDMPADGSSSWTGQEISDTDENLETMDLSPSFDGASDLTDASQTIDLSDEGTPSWSGHSAEDASQTLDLPHDGSSSWVGESSAGDDDRSQTLPESEAAADQANLSESAQTIDLSADGNPSWAGAGDSSRTLDLPTDGKASWEKTQNLDSSQTVDLPARGVASWDNSASGDSSETVDPSSNPPPNRKARPAEKTIAGGQAQPTLMGGESDHGQEEGLASAWEGTLAGHQPNQTLRVESTITSSVGSSIVVKPRALVKTEGSTTPSVGADYELLSVIGEGGMGVVYSARQASVDRLVAVKMLKGERTVSADQRDKFISEAVVTGDLDHPNIVPIYDLGANEQGALFYSMKQVHGTPWMKVIRKSTLEENLEILMKVADAVGFAHEAGVIHRDLKPENVMLGKHGEVLVMDWGLALTTAAFRALGSITQSGNMGGTPAYMSPEMATGPVERVTHLSDIYLLGGILYEIVTGQLPHTGNSVLECLRNAAKNNIQPTKESGELLEIAYKAMSTRPEDRYQDVESLQKAIREYRSHSESIRLAYEAEKQLATARETDDYRDFANAMYGFENAVKLWSGNSKALRMLSESKLAYADCAYRREDYDLALSVLDSADPDHEELQSTIDKARRERNARQNRIRTLRYVSAALVGVLLLVISAAFFLVKGQRDRAVVAEAEANKERDRAVTAEADARSKRDLAEAERIKAVAAEQVANEQRQSALDSRKLALEEKERADVERDKALAAQKAEELARRKEQYESYVAEIGLAAARIKENSFDSAVEILDNADEDFRNWEWGRLAHLCQQSAEDFAAEGPMDTVAFDATGKWLATGSWDGKARIWDARSGEMKLAIPHGRYVHAVAFSPKSNYLTIGSSEPVIKLVDPQDGRTIREFPGHEASVLSLAFSPDGTQLLSTSYDKTARLWDVESGRLIQTLLGHNWWVWSAAFSPDARQIVTASQDGKVIVWRKITKDGKTSYERRTEFAEHGGPVYTAEFSPDGTEVASGGFDKRVLIWNPDEVPPVDLRKRVDRIDQQAPKFRALEGHTGSVRAVSFSPKRMRPDFDSPGDASTAEETALYPTLLVSGSQDNTVRVWDAATGSLIKTLRGHGGQVRSCAFSKDGLTIASASHDKQAKLWNLDGYQEVRVLRGRVLSGHSDAVLAASFSPDGKQIVTASRDRTARTWSVQTGNPGKKFAEGHEFLATAARFTPDGQTLITAGGDDTVRAWDIASGTQRKRFNQTGRSSAVAVSHDGQLVLTGSNDRSAKVWDLTSGNLIQQLIPAGTAANPIPMEDRADVTAVAFAGDDRSLLVGDTNGRAWLWKLDSTDNTWKEAATLQGHGSTITAAAFTPSGDRVLTASGDRTVGQWDVATGRELRDRALQLEEWVASLAVSSDGNTAITASADGRVQVWDINKPALLRSLPVGKSPVNHVDIAPSGKLAATVSAVDRTVRLWDLATGREILAPNTTDPAPFLDGERLGGLIWSATFAPSGEYLVTIGGNDAQLWDVRTGRANMAFSPHGAVASASFSPDGRYIVTGSWDNSAKIWNVASGNSERKLFGAHTGFVNSAVFSPDGSQVLTASDDGTARLWDAATGKVSSTVFAGHEGRVRSAVFSADGSRILTGSNDKTARIWDARTARELQVLTGHEWAVRCAVFSPDGTVVLTGSEDNKGMLWDAATGERLFTLLGHSAPVTAVAISPDGQRALTGSQDNTIKLWDATTGKEILTLTGHEQEVTAVAFSPVGNEVVSSSRDGSAIVWLAVDWDGDVQGVPTSTPAERNEFDQPLPVFPPVTRETPNETSPQPETPTLPEKPAATDPPNKTEQPDPTTELPELFPSEKPEAKPEMKTPVAEPPADLPLPELPPAEKTTPTETPLPEVPPKEAPVEVTPPEKKPSEKSPMDDPLPELPLDLFPENKPSETTEEKPAATPDQKKPVESSTDPLPELPPDLFPGEKPEEKKPAEKPPAELPTETPEEKMPVKKQPTESTDPLPELPLDLFPEDKPSKKPITDSGKKQGSVTEEKTPAPAEPARQPMIESIDDLFNSSPKETAAEAPEKKPATPAKEPSAGKEPANTEQPLPELPIDLFPPEESGKKPASEPAADPELELPPPTANEPAEKKPVMKTTGPATEQDDPLPALPPDLFPGEEPKEKEPSKSEESPKTTEEPRLPSIEELPAPTTPPATVPSIEQLPDLPDLFPAAPEKKEPPRNKPAEKPAGKASSPKPEPPPVKLFQE